MAVSPPPKSGGSRKLLLLVIGVALIAGLFFMLLPKSPDLAAYPTKFPDKYRQMVSAFTVAATKIKVGDNPKGEKDLAAPYRKPTEIIPEEPAAWANLALWYIRSSMPKEAEAALEKAKTLAPKSGFVEMLYGAFYMRANKHEDALQHFKKAVEFEPGNARIRYALADFIKNHPGDNADAQVLEQWQKILELQPSNVRAMIETAYFASNVGKSDTLNSSLELLKQYSSIWPESKRLLYDEVVKLAHGADNQAIGAKVPQMCNVLRDTLQAHQGSDMLLPTVAQANNQNGIADPLDRFILLPNPSDVPAPADELLTFTKSGAQPGQSSATICRDAVLVAELTTNRASGSKLPTASQGDPVLITGNGKSIHFASAGAGFDLPFPGGPSGIAPGPDGLLLADVSYHFRSDIILAGAGGFRLYRQSLTGTYADSTSSTKLPPQITNGPWTGAWVVDVEQDGDLDIVLGSKSGEPNVLRNNGDQTFAVTHPFKGVSGVSAFLWADIDGDGDSDVTLIDGQGALHIFENLRSGIFKEVTAPKEPGKVLAVSVCDVQRKGNLDVVALDASGQLWRVFYKRENRSYVADKMDIQWPSPPADGSARIFFADLDNNGAQDLVATSSAGTQVWLGQQNATFKALQPLSDLKSASLAEPNAEGRVDLLGVDKEGKPVRLANKGPKNYHSFTYWPRSQYLAEGDSTNKAGDKRINTYGIGGSVELRSGLLDQLVPISGSQVHFGLGDYSAGDASRIYWPNGRMNGYFEIPSGKRIWAEQNLGGSCPWLFAWNGKEVKFVTDILWSSPLGLRINAQGTAPVGSTLDWVRVGGDQLAPKDGYYDLRITAELWETHFFDMVKLMTVDHPADTEIYVDERFSVPPLKPQIHVVTIPTPVNRAVDDLGADVTAIVSKRDGKYLDTFGRGEYQGVTRDHYVELELGAAPPANAGKPWLIAYGWTHPTDSSINVALGQGYHDLPRMIDLEIPDGRGGWRVARPREGFPAGKNKTMLFDLSGLFSPGAPRKVRLRTNLEVYWDFLGYATERNGVNPVTQTISPETADLHYRGFSVINGINTSSPETPDYNILSGTGQRWLDLVGYYTRFGDVKELLDKVDDRYVILNAGDEISLKFPEAPPPSSGAKRDFIFVSDGWEKDGNFNTGFNQTVLPLPYHADHTYSRPPTTLEEDPVYQRHKRDWDLYQTRYVEPASMKYALRPSR